MTTWKNSRAHWSSIIGLLTVICLDGSLFSLSAQNRPRHVGLPDDWSHRQLVFSNPGTDEQLVAQDAPYEKWSKSHAIQDDTRFKIQQVKRRRARLSETWDSMPVTSPVLENESLQAENARAAEKALERELKAAAKADKELDRELKAAAKADPPVMQRDWNIKLGNKPPPYMYPAKFTFDINAAPDCANDYVVFPVGTGSAGQAKLIAFNNLYVPGFCGTAATPSFKFAYQLGGGQVRTSPVLSLDGTKIAFVESVDGASIFHVLTIGTTGTNGTSTAGVKIGAAGGNNAVDTSLIMSLASSVTRSSPFVDYANDVAYVGDDAGRIHKYTGVFTGTLAEAGAPWPRSVGGLTTLTGPVAWNGNIFAGGSNGSLYCITTAGDACANPSIIVGTIPILDPPIVDGSTNQVFVATQTASSSILVQVPTSLATKTTVLMGNAPGGSVVFIHNGAFNHNYLTGPDPSAGFMYFCGGDPTGDRPTLYRVGFNAAGQINGTRDLGNSFVLGDNNANDEEECSPLTEIYNPNTPGGPTDLLFVTMAETSHGCQGINKACVASLNINSFPIDFRQAVVLGGSGEGTTAIVVDNVADVVPTWLASTAHALNAVIVDSNGNVQQATVAGTSKSGAHPVWSTTVNATTTDGTVTWTMRGPNRGSWQANHAYSLNDVITDYTSNTATYHLHRVTTAGTSGPTVPNYNQTPGGTTTNGTVTFTNLGPYTPSGVASIYFADVKSFLAYKFTQTGLQ